jgi:hypothetical protein
VPSLIHVSTSVNDIEHISWFSVHSSHVLNIMMLKNSFIFESEATTEGVSMLVMSSLVGQLILACEDGDLGRGVVAVEIGDDALSIGSIIEV